MDERQIREIAKVVFQMMKDQSIISDTGQPTLPVAYVLLSQGWQEHDSHLYNDVIDSLAEKYQWVLVLPEANDMDKFMQTANCSIVTRDDVAEPAEGSVSFFPIPCRDLISKTALCLSDDFNSHWVKKCIEKGTAIYMRKEAPMFTGKEPVAYQKTVLAYYQDVKSYGIKFLEEKKAIVPILQEKREAEKMQKKSGRYITMADLENVDSAKVFRIQEGDTFTALAKEYIEKLGVRVMMV